MKNIFTILKGKFRFSLIKVLYIYVSVNVCIKYMRVVFIVLTDVLLALKNN